MWVTPDRCSEAALADDPTIGRMFGHYQIVQRIGEGGMGTVYLAVQPRIGKRVAIKILRPECAQSPTIVQRFFQEARLVNEIGDEHIVDVLDYGEDEAGNSYFIMEYLEGQSLASMLERHPLDENTARDIGAQTARTLGAVHSIQVVHRDLKPDNIFVLQRVDQPRFVKLLDFGIAKLLGSSDREGSQPNLTLARSLLGTPLYISPEQVFGKDVGPRADIYALGCILYEMVSGRPPFQGNSVEELLEAHVRRAPVPLRELVPSVSPDYERITMKCLAKEPDFRFPRAADVVSALRPLGSGQFAAVELCDARRLAAAPTLDSSGVASLERINSAGALAVTSDDKPRATGKGALLAVLVCAGLLAGGVTWWKLGRAPSAAARDPIPAAGAGQKRAGGASPRLALAEGSQVNAAAGAPQVRSGQVPLDRGADMLPAGLDRSAGKVVRAEHTAPKPQLSVEQRKALESLQRLCEQGTIKPAECRAKRLEIMRRQP